MKTWAGLTTSCLLLISAVGPAPVIAADWQDNDCRTEKDDGGHTVKVCRDRESIGIFWGDDSYVGTPEKARSTAAQLVSAIETR